MAGALSTSDHESDLMVTTRARRPNAGNRMATLLAQSAQEEEWGEEWEDAPDEEDFHGGPVDEQQDYNMDSSSSSSDDGGSEVDEAGEKELRKAERREKSKKRKAAANPFAARLAATTRKKAKLQGPAVSVAPLPTLPPPRPKKKSERASWIPTEEDGPVRTSSRKQTVANKETTMAKLKEKDRRRDDTLAVMRAAEARKAKVKEPPLTQAERLAEAARNERINKKTLHRWEEAEEARAAERQAKLDALKNRQIDGPFIRFYSGPAIWVDDKICHTGKDAPTIEELEETVNKEPSLHAEKNEVQPESSERKTTDHAPPSGNPFPSHSPPRTTTTTAPVQPTTNPSHIVPGPSPMVSHQNDPPLPWAAASQGGDIFMGSHGISHAISHATSSMLDPPTQDSFLFGIDQYAQNQQTHPTPDNLPPNPFAQPSSYQHHYPPTHSPFPPAHASMDQAHLHPHLHLRNPTLDSPSLPPLQTPHPPPPPPPPPRRKVILRALRNLLILSSFPALDLPAAPSSRSAAKTPAALLKDKDRAALIHLSSTLFAWSPADASSFVSAMLTASTLKAPRKKEAPPPTAPQLAFPSSRNICPITNAVARYRDPETGMPYRDARAFGVLRGVVGAGFVWSAELGCYVGGRARPLESMGGKGFLGMPPVKTVPRRFWDIQKKPVSPASLLSSHQKQQQQQQQKLPPSTIMPVEGSQRIKGSEAESEHGVPVRSGPPPVTENSSAAHAVK